jgi:glycerol 2-dehydrogenase (NADP+)
VRCLSLVCARHSLTRCPANEEHVGRAITDSGIPRSEFYVTTKLCVGLPTGVGPALSLLSNNNAHHRVREAFDKSLAALGTDYIDLFLVHWPQASVDGRTLAPDESPTIVDTWKEMEKLLDTGELSFVDIYLAYYESLQAKSSPSAYRTSASLS